MTPKYASTATRPRSTLAQFRSFEGAGIDPFSTSPEVAWWRFMTVRGPLPKRTLDLPEERALSKATGPAGGYLVPSDLDALVTAARRSRAAIGAVARNITTENGVTFSLGAASAHGTGSWVAEAAASTPSDETFAQANLGAHKGVTSVIVSEELAQDSGVPFDEFLADEFGQRLVALEEPAFATGDGTGKPLGVAHASSGGTVVNAATGSSTSLKWAD